MGYRIEYTDGLSNIIRRKGRKKRNWWPVVFVILLLSVLVGPIRERVFHLMIPGDDDVTIQAFTEMVASFREGDSVREALEVFCREVIYEGA